MDLTGFNAAEVEPENGVPPVPAGDYRVVIVDTKDTPTKDGTGRFLELQFKIVAGEFQNRTLFHRLNLHNKNPKAVQIARGELSAICRAVGVMTPNDSSELCNRPMLAKVAIKKDPSGQYDDQNTLKRFRPIQQQPVNQQEPVAAGVGAVNGAAPWGQS